MSDPALWWPPAVGAGGRPVIFFPPAGAEPSAARPLLRNAAGVRFGVAQLPGRGTRSTEPAPRFVRALVAELAGAVARLGGPPPLLLGHSFGGLLAYGVAAELELLGVPAGRLVVVASTAPSAWKRELALDVARYGDDPDGFVRRRSAAILAHGGVPAELLAHRDFGDRARELVAADVALSRCGFGTRALHTPVTSVVARDDTVLAPGAADGWADVAAGDFCRYDVPGGHFFYRTAPERLVAQVRLELQVLDGAYELA